MANLNKMLRNSEGIEFEEGKVYELPVSKKFCLFQAVVAFFIGGVLFWNLQKGYITTEGDYSWYYMAIAGVFLLYGLISVICMFTVKIKMDDEKITIPSPILLIGSEKLYWDNVEEAELTAVITYKGLIMLIIKKLFAPIFANAQLNVTHRDKPNQPKYNFAIFDRVGNKSLALGLIRARLGDRFTVYSKNR